MSSLYPSSFVFPSSVLFPGDSGPVHGPFISGAHPADPTVGGENFDYATKPWTPPKIVIRQADRTKGGESFDYASNWVPR